jgi:2-polyprenyl-6-methoxyphenol hydroxylase-like FAD-dependent oxidoreductase
MPYTIEQLDFLGAHMGVAIPPGFIENKKLQKEFQTLRSTFDSNNPDLSGFYAVERIRAALAKADQLAKTGRDFASALKELAEAENLLKVPPPPTVPPPPLPKDPPPPLPRDAQELSEPIAQTPEQKPAPLPLPKDPPPDPAELKKVLADAEKAVEDSLAALKNFDARIAAARDTVKPVAALKSKYPKLGFDADEKRMTDLIARAAKANSEQPAVLKQLQAEVASGNDAITKNDAVALKALAGNAPAIIKNAQAAAKTVSAASRMLDNIDAGVKFVQKTAADADKLVTRLNAISLPAVEDMQARAALIPKIDASGADDGQKEILKQMVFTVGLPAAKIEKELAKCKNAKSGKALLEKLRKAGNDSDARRAVLAQSHALIGDAFRMYRDVATFRETLSGPQKEAVKKIQELANTEYTFAMQASVEASDDAKEVKESKKGKKIEKKEDLLTPDPKLKSKDVAVMGGGPVGLLAAIESAMRGGKVAIYEARGGDSGKELHNRLNTIVLHKSTEQRLKKVGAWNDVLAKIDQDANAVPVGALETILLARAKSLGVKFHDGKTVTDAVRSKDGKTVTLTVDGEKKPVIVQLVVVAAGAGFAKGGDKVSMAEKFGFDVVKAEAKDHAVTGVFDPTSAARGGLAPDKKEGWGYGFKAPDVEYLLTGLSEKEYGEFAKDPAKLEAFVRQAAVNYKLGNRDFKKGPTGKEVKPAAFPIEIQQAQNLASEKSGAVLVGDSAATPHPATGMGLNTGAREIDAIADLVGNTGDEDEALAAYDWETNRNTNVMVAMAMGKMAENASKRCENALKKLNTALDTLKTPLATQIKDMAKTAGKVVESLYQAAKKDDGADNWKLSSANIKRIREIEEQFVAVLDLTKTGAKLDDAIDILDKINGTKTQAKPGAQAAAQPPPQSPPSAPTPPSQPASQSASPPPPQQASAPAPHAQASPPPPVAPVAQPQAAPAQAQPQPPAAPAAAPAPNAPRWTKIKGVEDFFLQKTQRMSKVEKLCEEATALVSLIKQKTEGDKKAAKWAPRIKSLVGMPIRFMRANDKANDIEAPGSKKGEADMKKAFDEYQEVVDEKNAHAKAIKALWIDDQKKRLKAELKKDKDSNSGKMAAALGKEEFMEMAQMSEVFAKKAKNGFDPYEATEAMKEPMEMCEVAAIYGYSTQDFTKINGFLRKDPSARDKADEKHLDAYITSCKDGLKKLPPYTGDAVRCDRTLHKSVIDELISSGTRTEKGFMSSGPKKVPNFGDIESKITGIKTGKDITMFSLHETEGEVLFPPGSKFKFVKFEPDGAPPITDHKLLAGVVDDKTAKGVFSFTQIS